METEASRAIVLSFVENFGAGRYAQALDLLANDATWWVGGTVGEYGLAGLRQRDELPALFEWIGKALPHGVKVDVRGITAEGGRVALETEALATTAQGRVYHNFLHFLYEVRDNKIVAVREYLDTLHAQKQLVEP